MNGFLKNVLQRHRSGTGVIQPRKRGLYESDRSLSSPITEVTQERVQETKVVSSNQESSVESNSPKQIRVEETEAPEVKFPMPSEPKEVSFGEIEIQTSDPISSKAPVPLSEKEEVLNNEAEVQFPRAEKTGEFVSEEETQFVQLTTEKRTKELLTQLQSKELIQTQFQDISQEPSFPKIQPNAKPPVSNGTSQSVPPLPSVKVHIGRIEIKAVKEKEKKVHRSNKPAPKIKSLDQILQERDSK